MRIEKQPGESWLVYTTPGLTQQEIADKDDAVITDDGLFIIHNDPKKTLTFIPHHALCSLRSWWKNGKVADGSMRNNMESHGQISEPNVHVLPQSVDSYDEVIDAEVVEG